MAAARQNSQLGGSGNGGPREAAVRGQVSLHCMRRLPTRPAWRTLNARWRACGGAASPHMAQASMSGTCTRQMTPMLRILCSKDRGLMQMGWAQERNCTSGSSTGVPCACSSTAQRRQAKRRLRAEACLGLPTTRCDACPCLNLPRRSHLPQPPRTTITRPTLPPTLTCSVKARRASRSARTLASCTGTGSPPYGWRLLPLPLASACSMGWHPGRRAEEAGQVQQPIVKTQGDWAAWLAWQPAHRPTRLHRRLARCLRPGRPARCCHCARRRRRRQPWPAPDPGHHRR